MTLNNKTKKFIKDAVMLSLVSVFMRAVGVSFNAYVNRKIGAESMGLFTLVMSVYGFAVTVAMSCVNLSAVKLTSERCADLRGCDKESWKKSMRSVVRSVTKYSLLFGLSSGVLLFCLSPVIAEKLLSDVRTLPSLRILALILPAISLSSALSGFFTGLRKVRKNAVVAISEQFMKIVVTSTALVMICDGSVEQSCLAVVGGSAIAEGFSLVLNFVMYVTDSYMPDKENCGVKTRFHHTSFRDAAKISFPAAVGSYARQGLTTIEHLAIPKGIRKSGLTEKRALEVYGLLQGIALPLVMFPYAIIGSFTSLLVPEISELDRLGDNAKIRETTMTVYRCCALFSLYACGIFTSFSRELGVMIYSSEEAAKYTLLLGLLVPVMYLDTAVDSVLKGLGDQVYIMTVNIADAACGVIFVLILTPVMGINGYILTVWICEIGNLAASIIKLGLRTAVGVRSALKLHIRPTVAVITATVFNLLLKNSLPTVIRMMLFSAVYVVLVLVKFKKKKNIAKIS